MLHELRKNRLADIHPSLSAIDAAAPPPRSGAIFGQKKLRSKKLKTLVNLSSCSALAGIQNSSPGQQWHFIDLM
jgi:hypothetical protein